MPTRTDFQAMLDAIDHIGIAVSDIDDRLPIWRDILGLEFDGIETVDDQDVRVAFLRLGDAHVELLEPTSDSGAVAGFLDDHGEGIHHLAARCENIEAARRRAEEAGLELLSDEPLEGARDKIISFVHPSDTGGVLLEFCQRSASGNA